VSLHRAPVSRTAPILVLLALAGCSSNSRASTVTYNAVVTTDDGGTTVERVKLTDDGEGTLVAEVVDTLDLGYGALPFLVGEGRVPEATADVPPECLANQSLPIDMATPCVVAPLLERLDAMLQTHRLVRDDVLLTGVFNTGFSEAYTEGLVKAMATDADTYAESLGYASDFAPEETPAN
jgi:hypothetical protein